MLRGGLHRSFVSTLLILTHIFVFSAPPQALGAQHHSTPGHVARAGSGKTVALSAEPEKAPPASPPSPVRGGPTNKVGSFEAAHGGRPAPAVPEAAAVPSPSAPIALTPDVGEPPAGAASPLQAPGKSARLEALARNLSRAIPAPVPPDAHLVALSFDRSLDEVDRLFAEIHRKAEAGEPTDEETALLEPSERSLLEDGSRLSAALDVIETQLKGLDGGSRVGRIASYRSRLAAGLGSLQKAFGDLRSADSSTKRALRALRALEELRRQRRHPERFVAARTSDPAGPARTSLPNEPLIPIVRPPLKASDLSAGAAAGGGEISISTAPPGPSDLAATLDAPFTTDITALAASLGGSPLAIYDYVRNNFEFVPYFGSQKGAAAALESLRGNDWDASSLLIALLRSSGTPCRYMRGTVEIPASQAASWVGARDANSANPILNTAGISAVGIVDGGGNVLSYRVDHVWVEAYVPYASYRGAGTSASGKTWVMLDPSFKTRTRQAGIPGMLGLVPFDEAGYLSTRRTTLPFEHYRDQVSAYLRTAMPGKSVADIPYEGTIDPDGTGLLPATLPFEIVSLASEFSEISDALRHKVTLELDGNPGVLLNQTITLPADVLKRMTIGYVPATPADQAIVDGYGGLDQTPAFAVNVRPILRLDGTQVASGGSVAYLDNVSLTVSLIYPNSGVVASLTHPYILAGDYLSADLDADQVSDKRLDRISAGIMAALPNEGTPSEDEDALKGAFLHFAGMSYFMELVRGQKVIDDLASYTTVRQVYEGLTSSNLHVSHIFDLPFFAVPGNLTIDVQRQTAGHLNIDNNAAQNSAHRRISGDNGSAQEHRTWETLIALEGISTIKSLMLANERGVPVFVINSGNCPSLCPQLNLSPSVEADIQSRVAGGSTVTTPRDETPLNQWHGVGYLVEGPGGGSAYLISGFLAGGETTGAPGTAGGGSITIVLDDGTIVVLTPGEDGSWDVTFYGDPVNAVNGNLYHTEDDIGIMSQGFPISFSRTYNAQSSLSRDLGYGWTHTYGDFLTEDPNGNVLWIDAAGNPFFFVKTGSTYTPPTGLHDALTKGVSTFTLTTKDRMVLTFDLSGKLAQVRDRNSNTQTIGRDGLGRISTVSDAQGRSLAFGYDASNRITSINDFTGRAWSYAYDGSGNLASATTPSDANTPAGVTGYTYYSSAFNNHNLQTITDPTGGVRTFRYYSNDKIFEQIDPAGYGEYYLYAPFFRQTRIVGRRGDRTTYTYDASGNLVALLDAEGGLRTFTYDAARNRLSRTDPRGYTTTYTYDARGNVLTIRDPINATPLTMTYDAATDRVASITDNRGKTWNYTSDAAGNRLTETDPLTRMTQATYDGAGNPLTQTDRRGKTTTMVYNAIGNRTERHDPLGNVHTYEYDQLGRLTADNRPGGTRIEFVYDVRDRLVELHEPAGLVSRYAYDLSGRRTSFTDPMGRVASFIYDARGRLTTTNAPGGVTTVQTFDAGENLIDFMSPRGHHWHYDYDLRGKPVRQIDPAGRVTTLTYDAGGNLVRYATPDGAFRTTTYDAADRVDRVDFSDGTFVDYTYDASSNVVTIANEITSQTFTYDDLNEIASFADSLTGESITYTADENGRMKTAAGPGAGTTTYTYDDAGRLGGIADFGGQATSFGYDGLDRRTSMALPNGLVTAYTYDPTGPLSGVTTRDAANHVIATRTLVRNARGEVTSLADELGTHTFGYDTHGRLTSATHPTLPGESYTYDASGNRLTSSLGTHDYDESDRIVSAGTAVFEHDAAGRITKKTDASGITRFTYDAQGRLRRVDMPAGGYVAYRYDPYGKKIETDLNGVITRYVYDRQTLAAEYDGAGTLLRRFVHGPGVDEPLAVVEGSARTYLTADHIGSIVALTDATGAVVGRVAYGAFGQPSFSPVIASNPFGFTGRIFERSTGLYDLRARFYDPVLGRFLTPDPEGQAGGVNLYAYGLNNPLNNTDPSGRVAWIPILMGIGGLVGAAFEVYNTPQSERTGNWWWLGPAAKGFTVGALATGAALVGGPLLAGEGAGAILTGLAEGAVGGLAEPLLGAGWDAATGKQVHLDPGELASSILTSALLGALTGGLAERIPGLKFHGPEPSLSWAFGKYVGKNTYRMYGQEFVAEFLEKLGDKGIDALKKLLEQEK